MILVDTSIWIDHFHKSNSVLIDLLNNDQVLVHPFVIGELAVGNLQDREEILSDLGNLTPAATATNAEALQFIDNFQLMGQGLSYVDVHLLASVQLTSARLWTNDKRLSAISQTMGIAYKA